MAFIKLNEVTLVDSAIEPNILIEENGEIKRIPSENIKTPHTRADWNETDITKPSFILNKPESLGSKVIVYTYNSGTLSVDGVNVPRQKVIDEWNSGSTLRMKLINNSISNILNIYYSVMSGRVDVLKLDYIDDKGVFTTVNITA